MFSHWRTTVSKWKDDNGRIEADGVGRPELGGPELAVHHEEVVDVAPVGLGVGEPPVVPRVVDAPRARLAGQQVPAPQQDAFAGDQVHRLEPGVGHGQAAVPGVAVVQIVEARQRDALRRLDRRPRLEHQDLVEAAHEESPVVEAESVELDLAAGGNGLRRPILAAVQNPGRPPRRRCRAGP